MPPKIPPCASCSSLSSLLSPPLSFPVEQSDRTDNTSSHALTVARSLEHARRRAACLSSSSSWCSGCTPRCCAGGMERRIKSTRTARSSTCSSTRKQTPGACAPRRGVRGCRHSQEAADSFRIVSSRWLRSITRHSRATGRTCGMPSRWASSSSGCTSPIGRPSSTPAQKSTFGTYSCPSS